MPQLHVGEYALPRVNTHMYLDVTLHGRSTWNAHVDPLLRRGKFKLATWGMSFLGGSQLRFVRHLPDLSACPCVLGWS